MIVDRAFADSIGLKGSQSIPVQGAGGSVQDAGLPTGSQNGAYALTSMAVGDNLLLAANYAWKAADDPAPFAIFVNTIAPAAPVTTAPGPRDVQLQSAPGGKSFRVQVQYTVPQACTSAAPCTLRAELSDLAAAMPSSTLFFE